MKTHSELIEYIDHVIASLRADYNAIFDTTILIQDQVGEYTKHRLAWDLAHMHKDLDGLVNILKRHQDTLQKDLDAGKSV